MDARFSVGIVLQNGIAVAAGHRDDEIREPRDPFGKRLAFVLSQVEAELFHGLHGFGGGPSARWRRKAPDGPIR